MVECGWVMVRLGARSLELTGLSCPMPTLRAHAPTQVFLAQKMMINKANIRGKPVITATQVRKASLPSVSIPVLSVHPFPPCILPVLACA